MTRTKKIAGMVADALTIALFAALVVGYLAITPSQSSGINDIIEEVMK